MVFIEQRYPTDCVIACLAMVLDVPYERVFKTAYPDEIVDITDGLYVEPILRKIRPDAKFTVVKSIDIRSITNRAILVIKTDKATPIGPSLHAVAWDPISRVILDPTDKTYGQYIQCYQARLVGALLLEDRWTSIRARVNKFWDVYFSLGAMR